MASSPGEPRTRTSAEFVESSVLEAVVPASSSIDLRAELEAWDGEIEDEAGSILPFLSQRTVLLLGTEPRFCRMARRLTYAQAR
jgi:hypothetical protein